MIDLPYLVVLLILVQHTDLLSLRHGLMERLVVPLPYQLSIDLHHVTYFERYVHVVG